MRFQQRDGVILLYIYLVGGILAKRHILLKWWLGNTVRAMERRLKKLVDAGYLVRPTIQDYRNQPLPEPILWLGWRGILYVAGLFGVNVQPPRVVNENQLRLLEKQLRDCGIYWVRIPNWSLVAHDLKIVDFRLAIEEALKNFPLLTLEKWTPEYIFRAGPDKVEYIVKDLDGNSRKMSKLIYPDAYFEIIDEDRKKKDEPHKARFNFELDMSTHDTKRFGRDKVAPGVAYIKSAAYKERFGSNSGHWLIVAFGGKTRISNLMRQTRFQAGENSNLFFFASFDDVMNSNVLTSPIWRQIGKDKPVPLLDLKPGVIDE